MASSVYFVIAGTWLFHEHLPASPGQLALRLTGITLAVLVLIMLSRQVPESDSGQTANSARTVPSYLADVRRR